jgi:hypothetical protein
LYVETWKLYEVEDVKPVAVYVVPLVVAILFPFL